jgi:glycosyltransferase involved in cell wall biosynthesis
MGSEGQPLHLGILCDYGVPLRPQSGIGVFVHNLVQGLLSSQPSVRITFLVSPGGQEDLQYLVQRWQPRVRIISAAGSPFRWSLRVRKLMRAAVVLDAGAKRCQQRAGSALRRIVPISTVLKPIRALLGKAKRAVRRMLERRIKPYDCDVWLVPFSGCKSRLATPSVLVIHDVVWKHFPDCLDGASRLTMENLVPRRAAEATLCVCMSQFIRDTDLLGVLNLPPEKVRMVPPAAPIDFPVLDEVSAEDLRPPALKRSFLLFPGAFRSYKNHQTLVEALRFLRDEHGVQDLDLAFTGENDAPEELLRLVVELGLEHRVHFLGCVERNTLAALYRLAFATVMPSLYEQGSFPVYEALSAGSPVACSDIPALREQCAALGDAMLYFDPHDPGNIAQVIARILSDRAGIIARQQAASRPLWRRTWEHAARDWLDVFREAIDSDRWQKHGLDRKLLAPWPRAVAVPAEPRERRRHVFLFLQVAYAGGVWETTKELVRELVALNREHGRLRLTLGLHEDQQDTQALERLGGDLQIERVRLNPIHRAEVERMVGSKPAWLADRPEHDFCFFSGAARTALEADGWLGLVDRFPLPLLPARPYCVVVYDMIQRVVPEAFDSVFFRSVKAGMGPTLHAAKRVVVTSPQTGQDVIDEYGLDPARVLLAPLACNPERRFAGLTPAPVLAARAPFILNTSNLSRHKGIETLLRGYARLKGRLSRDCPELVVCGVGTHRFSASAATAHDPQECRAVRQLMIELGLQEGYDVVFLGFVRDAELLDLYQRSAAVVNTALYDNGSFLLTEGAYFGRRCVSSLYAAAQYLCRRFQVPARFFPAGDSEALAATLQAALREPLPGADEVQRLRERFLATDFSVRRYAERVYEALETLAGVPSAFVSRRICA